MTIVSSYPEGPYTKLTYKTSLSSLHCTRIKLRELVKDTFGVNDLPCWRESILVTALYDINKTLPSSLHQCRLFKIHINPTMFGRRDEVVTYLSRPQSEWEECERESVDESMRECVLKNRHLQRFQVQVWGEVFAPRKIVL